MLTKEILNSHTLKTLKSEIKKHNDKVKVSGYSKLTKPKIVELMMKHKDKFMHIKHAEKKEKKAKAKAPKGTHKMPDGSEMTGKVHSKDSKPVKKAKPLTVTTADGKVKELKKKAIKLIPKKKKEEKKEEPKKGRKKTVKILTLAKGQGSSTKIGNVIGPDGNSYEPSQAAPLWEARGFKRVELSKADLKKTEKLAIKYGPFGKYGLGNQLESFLKNKF